MMKLATQLCILRQVSIKSFLITAIVSLKKEFRIFMRFWETAHLPLPLKRVSYIQYCLQISKRAK